MDLTSPHAESFDSLHNVKKFRLEINTLRADPAAAREAFDGTLFRLRLARSGRGCQKNSKYSRISQLVTSSAESGAPSAARAASYLAISARFIITR
jgi:hypothetical protein